MAQIISIRGRQTGETTGEPFNNLLREHLERLKDRGSRPSSMRQNAYIARVLERELGAVPVSELIQPDAFERLYVGPALRAGMGRHTVNQAVTFARAALRARGLPYLHIRKARVLRRVPLVMGPGAVRECLRIADRDDPRVGTAARLAWRAGLRRGELCRFHSDDLEPAHVRVQARDGWEPKDYEERRIPIPAEIRAGLDFQGYLLGCSESALDKRWRRILRTAGHYAPGQGLHTLRRTWATDLLIAGAPVNEVMRFGGWSSLVTMQRYLGAIEDHTRSAVERLEI